ncbi:putative iron compound ABC transporter permease protein [Methanocella paludicola SANAE]|uniref:Cobalamin import system permease protein BtuC n=1 Tax=Methanocella paludicola (strain DSM 17711 / JCM 13418 / NBRC 101707 / SANAE) TaxID=304371 RepID=D1YXH6_METPS|nr:iron ABC transporter permease [Methanocella paludicola]BAI61148.1 putative iron compound ABC transporter permease protein [Methanocella paludicola SANAE]
MAKNSVAEALTAAKLPVNTPWAWKSIAAFLFFISPLPAFVVSLFIGNFGLSFNDTLGVIASRLFGGGDYPGMYYSVIFDVRLPRILTAMLVGGALAISGAAFQGIFKNPLVDPYILGLSSGAAFGAALSIAVLPALPLEPAAFVFSLIAIGLAYLMARTKGETPVISLVLSGVITSAVFTALLGIIQIQTNEKALQSIVLWIMGSFNASTWSKLGEAWYLIVAGCAVIILLRWRLNVLALGDEEARSVGMNTELYKVAFIVAASLVASASVAIAGIISLVGLIVPHMVRMVIGPDHRLLIPLSFTFGAAFLVIVDDAARAAFGFEIPVSIFTTLIGAPFFIFILRRAKVGGWE